MAVDLGRDQRAAVLVDAVDSEREGEAALVAANRPHVAAFGVRGRSRGLHVLTALGAAF